MAAKIEIELPCKAHEIELKLHSFCDHYGMDANVTFSGVSARGRQGEFLTITENG